MRKTVVDVDLFHSYGIVDAHWIFAGTSTSDDQTGMLDFSK